MQRTRARETVRLEAFAHTAQCAAARWQLNTGPKPLNPGCATYIRSIVPVPGLAWPLLFCAIAFFLVPRAGLLANQFAPPIKAGALRVASRARFMR